MRLSCVLKGEIDMRRIPAMGVAALVFACGAAMAAPMAKDEYKAAKKTIAAEYAVERQKCGSRYGVAAELCIAHAHGARDVAKAELEATYKPGPRTYYDAAMARARTAYTVAKDECNEKRGAEKKACLKVASDARQRAFEEAKTSRAAALADEARAR
jgi:hypothetical protein